MSIYSHSYVVNEWQHLHRNDGTADDLGINIREDEIINSYIIPIIANLNQDDASHLFVTLEKYNRALALGLMILIFLWCGRHYLASGSI
jgi:hypothetical protein